MQQLHLVGFTTDLDSLIFSSRKGAKSGNFVLPLDDDLVNVIAEAIRRRNQEGGDLEMPAELAPAAALRRQSLLSPREIQDRLRAGRTLEEVASEAAVGEEWIARFAAPVVAERARVIARVREFVYSKPRRGESGEPLGLSVRWNLADRGIRLTDDEFSSAWTAYQVADQAWMLTFSFVSRQRSQRAEWEVDLEAGEVFAHNRLASDLAYVEPGRRRRAVGSLQPERREVAQRGASRSDEDRPVLPMVNSPLSNTRPRPVSKVSKASKSSKATSTKSSKPSISRPRPTKTVAKKPRAAKATGKKMPAKKAAARKTAAGRGASKSSARRSASPTRSGRGAPDRTRRTPLAIARPAATVGSATTPEQVPNELDRRRRQLVADSTRNAGRGYGRSRPGFRPTPATVPRSPRPFIAATPVADAAPSTPEPGLDVVGAEDAAEARRAERRRARAEARRAEGRAAPSLPGETEDQADVSAAARDSAESGDAGDGRIVTIRANRATPPTGDEGAEVVLPANRPPLRPAQPAAQPRRRRFSRAGR